MLLLVLYVLLALGVSFLCSIFEAVLLSVTPAYIATLKTDRPRRGQLLQMLKDDIDRPLAAILTLNTIAHTVGAAGAGAQAATVFGEAWIGVISAVLTLLILVFSEIIPKTIGALYWRSLAPSVAWSVHWLARLMLPFVIFSQWITKLLSRNREDPPAIRQELYAMADVGHQSGELARTESTVLKRLMKLPEVRVDDVMTPRVVMSSLDETMTVEQFISQHRDIPFSRLPIHAEDHEDISGFVLKADIFAAALDDKQRHRSLSEFSRKLAVIPEGVSLPLVLDTLLRESAHIALVVDEYGGVEGLVTMEDVIETLLGLEIVDESDAYADLQQMAREQWRARARRRGAVGEQWHDPREPTN